jgi:hypothetical protein
MSDRCAWVVGAGLALVRDAQAEHLADVQRRFPDRLSPAELRTLGRVFTRLTPQRE